MDKLELLLRNAELALEELAGASQKEVDLMCRVISQAISQQAPELAELAVEETGMGDVQSKIIKNTTVGSGV